MTILALTTLVLPLLFGFTFTKWCVPYIAQQQWFFTIGDKALNIVGNVGCLLLYVAIWGNIYTELAQQPFLMLYCSGCVVLAFSLIRAHDKGAFGGIMLNAAFALLTIIPFFLA